MLKAKTVIVTTIIFSCLLLTVVAQQGPTSLTDLAHSFVDLFFDGKMDLAMSNFDSTLIKRTSAQRLHIIRNSILMSQGPLQKIGQPILTRGTEEDTVIVTLKFEKGSLEARIRFAGSGRISGYSFNPEGSGDTSDRPPYAVPEQFEELDIAIDRPDLASLPGCLTIPRGEGRFPAILLVQGSGPGGMDAGFGPNRPFRDLAHGIACQGIATLRFDRRSFANPDWFLDRAYTVKEEIMDDVIAALQLLKEHPKIDASRIYLLGHSLGGMLAPRIAKHTDSLAGLIFLAAPSRPLSEVIGDQVEYLMSLDEPGMTSTMFKETQRELEAISLLTTEELSGTTQILGAPPAYWLDLKTYDQVVEAQMFKGPILILQGMRDFQVIEEDLLKWERIFGMRANVNIRRYPFLNHLFMAGEGPSSYAEYTRKPGYVDKKVIDDIANWIHSKSSRQ